MGKAKYYLKSMRFRTLPLSLSGIIMGTGLAAADYHADWLVVALIALTTLFLQCLSNVCNEYGDWKSGTDGEKRVGPNYSEGILTERDYRAMILALVVLCCASGTLMIWQSFGTLMCLQSILLLILGAAAIIAAIKYTLGHNPYGYRGMGDLYVFLFFGLLSVLGSYFVVAHEVKSWLLLLPAAAIGLFSVGVLNINNIRDMNSDCGTRRTIPLRIGGRNARIYQSILIALGWAAMMLYTALRCFDPFHYLFVLTLPLYIVHLTGLWRNEGAGLDKYLPLLVMSTFAFAILSAVGYTVFLW